MGQQGTDVQDGCDILRPANDWLWLAGCLEGLCSVSVVLQVSGRLFQCGGSRTGSAHFRLAGILNLNTQICIKGMPVSDVIVHAIAYDCSMPGIKT